MASERYKSTILVDTRSSLFDLDRRYTLYFIHRDHFLTHERIPERRGTVS